MFWKSLVCLKYWDQPGAATSQLGAYKHSRIHAGGRFGTSVARLGDQVCQGQLSPACFRDRKPQACRGGELLGLTKGLNWGAISAGQGLLW